jgi:hypothetical protein
MQAFKIFSVIILNICAWAAPLWGGELMPWNSPVTVTARMVVRTASVPKDGHKEEFLFLKFSTPLDFNAVPGDELMADIKNVRYVTLITNVEDFDLLDMVVKSRHPIPITGTF